MGYMSALSMAAAVDDGLASLREAMVWHLRSNHYPPVSLVMVEPCLAAILAANEGEAARLVELPGGSAIEAWHLIELLHLDAFVNDDEGYDEDAGFERRGDR